MSFNPALFYQYGVSSAAIISYTGQQGIECATTGVNNPLLYPPSNSMTMSPDGTKVFAVLHNGNNEGFTRDSIMQFNLSTPWDLTTMSTKIGNTPTLNSFPGFSEQAPTGAMFSPDGLNLYVSGSSFNRVYRYTLSSAYTPSTATAHSSFSTGLTGIVCLQFSQDGYYMFINSSTGVNRFLLGTPWDITTATLNGTNIIINGSSFYFKTDGLSIFSFGGGAIIYRYYFSIAWDLSSYVKVEQSPSISSIVTNIGSFNGIYMSSDGKRFFFSNYVGTGYRVKAVDLSKPFIVNAVLG